MIHDLTVNSDFLHNDLRSVGLLNLQQRLNGIELTPKDEVVYTGDYVERQTKQFYVDYFDDKLICDCCGGPIVKVPWNYSSLNKTLCKECEKELDNLISSKDTRVELLDEGKAGFVVAKPWSIDTTIPPLFGTDNVLLWD